MQHLMEGSEINLERKKISIYRQDIEFDSIFVEEQILSCFISVDENLLAYLLKYLCQFDYKI